MAPGAVNNWAPGWAYEKNRVQLAGKGSALGNIARINIRGYLFVVARNQPHQVRIVANKPGVGSGRTDGHAQFREIKCGVWPYDPLYEGGTIHGCAERSVLGRRCKRTRH